MHYLSVCVCVRVHVLWWLHVTLSVCESLPFVCVCVVYNVSICSSVCLSVCSSDSLFVNTHVSPPSGLLLSCSVQCVSWDGSTLTPTSLCGRHTWVRSRTRTLMHTHLRMHACTRVCAACHRCVYPSQLPADGPTLHWYDCLLLQPRGESCEL